MNALWLLVLSSSFGCLIHILVIVESDSTLGEILGCGEPDEFKLHHSLEFECVSFSCLLAYGMCANKAVFLIRTLSWFDNTGQYSTMQSILCHQSGDTYPIYRVCTSSEDILSVNEDGRRLAPRHPTPSLSSPYDMLQAHASPCSPLSVCCQNPFRGQKAVVWSIGNNPLVQFTMASQSCWA